MRYSATLLAVVLSIVHVAYTKRVRHVLAANATKTNATRGFPVMAAVLGNYNTDMANMALTDMGLVNARLGKQVGKQTDIDRLYSAPTALPPPRGGTLFQLHSRKKNRWQDLRGGMAEVETEWLRSLVNKTQAASVKVAKAASVEAAPGIAKAQAHIANVKARKKDLDTAMVNAHVKMDMAMKRKSMAWWEEAPPAYYGVRPILKMAIDKEYGARPILKMAIAEEAQTDIEDAKDAVLAINKEMDKVKAAMTVAKAELVAAKKGQSRAGQTADRLSKDTGRVNDWRPDYWETPFMLKW